MKLNEFYQKVVAPKLVQEFELKSTMAVPAVKKVTVNVGIGTARDSKEDQEVIVNELARIVGQRPSLRSAKVSVAGFGIRQGQPVGVAATLRGQRMYDFLQKLFGIVLPRLRDFRGVSRKSFDQSGNYTLGLNEFSVFPEVDLSKASKIRGLEITIVTNTQDRKKAERLLEELGMPFEKERKE